MLIRSETWRSSSKLNKALTKCQMLCGYTYMTFLAKFIETKACGSYQEPEEEGMGLLLKCGVSIM